MKFLTELGVLLGADRNETEQSMLKVIDLEQRIAEVRTSLDVCFVLECSAVLSAIRREYGHNIMRAYVFLPNFRSLLNHGLTKGDVNLLYSLYSNLVSITIIRGLDAASCAASHRADSFFALIPSHSIFISSFHPIPSKPLRFSSYFRLHAPPS